MESGVQVCSNDSSIPWAPGNGWLWDCCQTFRFFNRPATWIQLWTLLIAKCWQLITLKKKNNCKSAICKPESLVLQAVWGHRPPIWNFHNRTFAKGSWGILRTKVGHFSVEPRASSTRNSHLCSLHSRCLYGLGQLPPWRWSSKAILNSLNIFRTSRGPILSQKSQASLLSWIKSWGILLLLLPGI